MNDIDPMFNDFIDYWIKKTYKLTEEQKSEINSSLQELKDAHSEKDVEKIKVSMDNVNTTFQGVSANLYSQGSGETNEEEDREVNDVDFEEVKG